MNKSGTALNHKNEHIAFLLAFLMPGFGHIYAGRIRKGIVFIIVIWGLFAWGTALKGEVFPVVDAGAFSSSLPAYQLVVDRWTNYFSYVTHFSAFAPCLLVYLAGLDAGDISFRHAEVGNTMLLLSGLLNILLMFSAADCVREANARADAMGRGC
ncbi:MAG: hypothetical protein CVV64_01975 [Candidatus Wallbacteria bacterium HGW-Wallbacteria-1]|jgi:hypothetical protein|uniref:DUF6677 domain-containing protein n=1 Tax=Candidatus Wallbacteria bacterium HGW-Wallbacteria-1 TaxID=2013854 RepID=A0A2N1PV78_9BACT|nr:MAG: hypothetical protein CVV64_01975 [Candidatus Wallbacteria bacterium HGW-Wallbacteria-1]